MLARFGDDYWVYVLQPSGFGRPSDLLGTPKRWWILSINYVPEVRALFAHCHVEPGGLKYRIDGDFTDARELITSGETDNV